MRLALTIYSLEGATKCIGAKLRMSSSGGSILSGVGFLRYFLVSQQPACEFECAGFS